MNPLDDYLEMKKEAGFGDMLRGAWRGFSGGVDPAATFEAGKSLAEVGVLNAKNALKGLSKKAPGYASALQAAHQANVAREMANIAPAGHEALTRGFSLGQKAQVPALAIGGTLALAGTVMAIRKIHGAMTKQRDFKAMMELNPQLAEEHEKRPMFFNQAYSSLRKMNPALTADPIVAGSFMGKLMRNPEAAGGSLAEIASMGTPQKQGLRVRRFGPLEMA